MAFGDSKEDIWTELDDLSHPIQVSSHIFGKVNMQRICAKEHPLSMKLYIQICLFELTTKITSALISLLLL